MHGQNHNRMKTYQCQWNIEGIFEQQFQPALAQSGRIVHVFGRMMVDMRRPEQPYFMGKAMVPVEDKILREEQHYPDIPVRLMPLPTGKFLHGSRPQII